MTAILVACGIGLYAVALFFAWALVYVGARPMPKPDGAEREG